MNNFFLVAMGFIGGGFAVAIYTAIVTKKYASDYNTLLSQHQQLQGRYDELVRQNGSTKAAKVPVKTTQPMVSYIGPEDGNIQGNYERFGPEQ